MTGQSPTKGTPLLALTSATGASPPELRRRAKDTRPGSSRGDPGDDKNGTPAAANGFEAKGMLRSGTPSIKFVGSLERRSARDERKDGLARELAEVDSGGDAGGAALMNGGGTILAAALAANIITDVAGDVADSRASKSIGVPSGSVRAEAAGAMASIRLR